MKLLILKIFSNVLLSKAKTYFEINNLLKFSENYLFSILKIGVLLIITCYIVYRLTKFFMLLTFPLAFPISKILDKILGEEMGTVYNKKRLIELLRVTHATNDLEKEEVDIVTGALIYKEKRVKSVMTPLTDCYLLNIKTVLNFETMAEIKEQAINIRIKLCICSISYLKWISVSVKKMFIDSFTSILIESD